MSTEPTELESRIKTSLDASAMRLDQDTQRRLAAMRAKAIKQKPVRPWFNFNAWGSTSALALSALLAILFVTPAKHVDDALPQIASQQKASHEQPEQITMLELLTNAEDTETATDPDFYVWIDEVLAAEGTNNAV